MASQPQSYGSIREFLDNLPNQPCIWQPENANICVTCLRINEPVARVCSVWAQALEEAPLEEIDFEEEVRSLPSVVEIEDEFEMVENVTPTLGAVAVAEIDIVEASSDWDMIAEPIVETPTEEIIEEALEIEESVEATEEVAEATIAEPIVETPTEEIIEEALEIEESVEATEYVAEAIVAEPMLVEATEYVAEATEDVALDTIQDAVDADAIAQEKVDNALEAEEIAAEAVVEAVNTEAEAVEAYADAVKEEAQAAEAVIEAVEAENVATEAVIEAAEQVTELIEKEADKSDIQEAVTELEDSVEKQEEAKGILTEAVTVEETAADEVETKSTIEEEAAEELEKTIVADEKASENLEEAITQEEKAEEEVKETIEASKELVTDDESSYEDKGPFIEGDNVTHGVYGNGTVLQATKVGKHWSVEVDFEEEKRRILGTFLTLNEDKTVKSEPAEESFKKPKSEEKGKEKEEEKITKVVADVVEIDHGKYSPGIKVTHKIFGKGEVKDSKPKGDDYKLEIEFEDGSMRNLLSTFVDIFNETEDKYTTEDNEEVAEPVTVEATKEEIGAVVNEVEAEAVIAEADILDTDVVYRRPKEKEKEAILDLSKPEVQDAEMVDDED
jgi:hypothetical protein